MKILEMIVSGLIKRGVLYEARNVNLDFDIPITRTGDIGEPREDKVTIKVNIDHMTLRVEKEEKKD